MASTSTNKQPLLVDRVFHYIVGMDGANNKGINVAGANTAKLLLSANNTDGAIVEDIYSVSRSASAYTINLFLSTSNDYLRPGEGFFVGEFKSATTVGARSRFQDMPKILAPVPYASLNNPEDKISGEPQLPLQFRALYVPKGKSLWAAIDTDQASLTDCPHVACQGGWY